MWTYLARRLLQLIPVFLGTTFLIYFLVFALPGDPVANLTAGKPANPTYEAFLREEFNLNDSFLVQYLKYLGGILTGDFGETFNGKPVSDIVAERFPVTLKLAGTAFVIELILGIAIGVWAAVRRGKFIDNVSLAATLVVISIPVFVLGYVVQYVFAVRLGWFPPAGIAEGWPMSYLLPAFVLAALSLAYVLRLTRQSLLETFNQDFVKTAKAKGLPARTVLSKYGLRNSLIPVITFLGADLAALMGGAVVVEGIFNIPGIGQQLFSSIKLGEATVVVGLVTMLVVVYLLVNLLVDVIYGFLDPRIRYE